MNLPELQRFADVAAGLQRRTEEAVLALARRLAVRPESATSSTRAGSLSTVSPTPGSNATARFDRSLYLGAAHDAGTADRGCSRDRAPDGRGSSSDRIGPARVDSLRSSVPRMMTRDRSRDRRAGFSAERIDDPARWRRRCSRTARSWAGFRGAWSSGPGRWATARCSRIRAGLTSAISSIGESSTARRFGPSARRFWPKMRRTGS